MWRFLGVVGLLTGCVTELETESATEQEANVVPWKQPAKWPYQVTSARLAVHYQATADSAMAQTVLADAEYAWTRQITQQGARAPIDNVGTAGLYDIWLQRGIDSLYVSSTATNPATTHDDAFTSMVLDPWGQYGGAEMRPNVFHEFRHGSQGTDDWNEHIWFFEAEATLWEAAEFGYTRLPYVWADVQAHPEWTPFKDDNYTTWFMYGGALYLDWIRQHVFANSLTWTNDVWLASRNPSGTNEPDFVDALNGVLAPRGTSVLAELVSFARARWYTGANANGTLAHGNEVPAVATRSHVRASGATRTTFLVNPQMAGTIYTVITKAPTDNATFKVSLSNVAASGTPVVQVVGRSNADQTLSFTSGPATVSYVNGQAVLAVTMLPASGTLDPDSVGTQLIKATVNIDK